MSDVRVVLTAGFNRARHVLALGELLHRHGVAIEGLLVVSPYSWARLRRLIRQRGTGFLSSAIPRLFGFASRKGNSERDAVADLLQEHHIDPQPLHHWAKTREVAYRSVSSINDPSAVDLVKRIHPDWVLYGGGGILRESFIEAADGRILNAHSGPLPEIRGMNACEWSLLLGYEPTVTVHLINRGIDTGGAISEHPVPIYQKDTLDSLRQRCVAIGVEAMCQTVLNPPPEHPDTTADAKAHRQCFVLAPVLRELLGRQLATGAYETRISERKRSQ